MTLLDFADFFDNPVEEKRRSGKVCPDCFMEISLSGRHDCEVGG